MITLKPKWTWTSDRLHHETLANGVRKSADVLLLEMYGARCDEFDPDCELCKRWKALDDLTRNPFDDGD